MANSRKRVFISFAIEDVKYRDFLVGQARLHHSPFEFIDMSVKTPWNEKEWRQRCSTKMRGCDGIIVLLSRNSYHSSGLRYEAKFAKEDRIPMLGVHIYKNDHGATLPELYRKKKVDWTWDNIADFIESL
jgi:CTP synthase (UTP-ammonia lyase)